MNKKAVLLALLALVLVAAGAAYMRFRPMKYVTEPAGSPSPNPSASPSASPGSEALAPATSTPDPSQYPEDERFMLITDKFEEGAYAGRLMGITDSTIKVRTEGEIYEYKLTDQAKLHMEKLEIKLYDPVIVRFDTLEDGTRVANALEKLMAQ